ncbi:septal ring lytic transglycosylase RlpA family protein [Dokdonella sp.]|uniref:septal ring lytic transglycosylase RlpA family protein n=1 Tax=Dokdonella sp. TaxID=2291710 RepID=UPI0037834238
MKLRLLACIGLCLAVVACSSHRPRRDGAAPAPTHGVTTQGGSTARGGRDTDRPQSERYAQDADNGPGAPPIDVSQIPEPVPKAEPRSRYGNKDSYSVLGKTYRVMPDARGYLERGIASWYGNKFHGFMTSSFETYDMYAFSAAHKTLPLPSYARVTNLDNGKSVVVRVNDRGPFHDDRIIDLSYAAAVKIGVWPKGTARVEVRAIDPAHPDDLPPSRMVQAPPPVDRRARSTGVDQAPSRALASRPQPSALGPAPATQRSAPSPVSRIYLQLAAFGERANAERALANAKRAGLEQVGIESIAVGGRTVHRVRVGPLADAEAADVLSARIERLGFGVPRVAIEP